MYFASLPVFPLPPCLSTVSQTFLAASGSESDPVIAPCPPVFNFFEKTVLASPPYTCNPFFPCPPFPRIAFFHFFAHAVAVFFFLTLAARFQTGREPTKFSFLFSVIQSPLLLGSRLLKCFLFPSASSTTDITYFPGPSRSSPSGVLLKEGFLLAFFILTPRSLPQDHLSPTRTCRRRPLFLSSSYMRTRFVTSASFFFSSPGVPPLFASFFPLSFLAPFE